MSNVTATLTYKGVPVELDLFTLDAETLAQVEKRVEKLLAREGWAAPAVAAAAPVKQPRPRATKYDADGTPVCPIHGTSMLEGQRGGYYCGHKAKAGEPAGPKGYCNAIAD